MFELRIWDTGNLCNFPYLPGTTWMEALVDYKSLVTGKFTDERWKNIKKRKDDEAIDDLVKILLSPDNIVTCSWGTIVNDLSAHENILFLKLKCTTAMTNI